MIPGDNIGRIPLSARRSQRGAVFWTPQTAFYRCLTVVHKHLSGKYKRFYQKMFTKWYGKRMWEKKRKCHQPEWHLILNEACHIVHIFSTESASPRDDTFLTKRDLSRKSHMANPDDLEELEELEDLDETYKEPSLKVLAKCCLEMSQVKIYLRSINFFFHIIIP